MKSNTKTKPKAKVVKALAAQFEEEIKSTLPVAVHKDGTMVYKGYLIKEHKSGNWAVYEPRTRDLVEQFFLKTCALMATKAYSRTDIARFREIKDLDNKYWANYSDTIIYKKNIKKVKEFDRYCVLLNRLENSQDLAEHYRTKISVMFKWDFV